MTINATAPILLALYVAAAERQGVARASGLRHGPERHPQGVHRPRHLDLPAAPVDAPRDRRLRVLRRASCRAGTRSRSPATTCARPGRRPPRSWPSRSPTRSPTSRRRVARGLDVDDFAAASRFFFAAWSELFEEVAKFRAARRMWARIVRDRFGATNPRSMVVPLPRPDRGLVAHRPVDRQQRRPDDGPGARRGPRRRPEPAHELARRGARPADRGGRPARPADPADPRPRVRRHRDARPAGRLVLRGDPDRRARGRRQGLPRRDRGAGRDARRHRGAASSSARSRSRPTASSGRSTPATRSSSGVNRFRDDEVAAPPTQRIDPEAERRQVERVRRVRAERSARPGPAALDELEAAARGDGQPLPPIIEAVKAYATVGEISDRLRVAWGEHRELITV